MGVKWKVQRDAGPTFGVPWDACGLRSCRLWRGFAFALAPRLDDVEEADELLVPVALHIADGAVEDVEGREQCRRAMKRVVVGHCPCATLLNWQAGRGAVDRLDLALVIDREDDGVGGRRTKASHSPRDRHRDRRHRAACRRSAGQWRV